MHKPRGKHAFRWPEEGEGYEAFKSLYTRHPGGFTQNSPDPPVRGPVLPHGPPPPRGQGCRGASHSPTCSPAPSSGGVPPTPNWGLDAYRPISWQLFLYVCPSLIGGVVSALGIHLGADSRTPPNPIQRCFLCGHHSSVDWLFHLACHWSRMTSDIARNVIHDLP